MPPLSKLTDTVDHWTAWFLVLLLPYALFLALAEEFGVYEFLGVAPDAQVRFGVFSVGMGAYIVLFGVIQFVLRLSNRKKIVDENTASREYDH
jgi:hypothetical protein